jgi:hypothetical protein
MAAILLLRVLSTLLLLPLPAGRPLLLLLLSLLLPPLPLLLLLLPLLLPSLPLLLLLPPLLLPLRLTSSDLGRRPCCLWKACSAATSCSKGGERMRMSHVQPACGGAWQQGGAMQSVHTRDTARPP